MYKFRLKLKIKGCKEVFKEELGPGVIASLEVIFDTDDALWAAAGLMREEDQFIKDMVEVQTEEIGNEMGV